MIMVCLFSMILLIASGQAYELITYDGVNEDWVDFALSEFEIPDYIYTIRFFDQPHKTTCGNYWQGGTIDVNTRATYRDKETGKWTIVNCQSYIIILNEELIHAYWWNEMNGSERYNYCDKMNVSGSVCWEHYVEFIILTRDISEIQHKTLSLLNDTLDLFSEDKIYPLIREFPQPKPMKVRVVIGWHLIPLIVLIGLIVYLIIINPRKCRRCGTDLPLSAWIFWYSVCEKCYHILEEKRLRNKTFK